MFLSYSYPVKYLHYRRDKIITFNVFYKQAKIYKTNKESAAVLCINVLMLPYVRHYPAIFALPKSCISKRFKLDTNGV